MKDATNYACNPRLPRRMIIRSEISEKIKCLRGSKPLVLYEFLLQETTLTTELASVRPYRNRHDFVLIPLTLEDVLLVESFLHFKFFSVQLYGNELANMLFYNILKHIPRLRCAYWAWAKQVQTNFQHMRRPVLVRCRRELNFEGPEDIQHRCWNSRLLKQRRLNSQHEKCEPVWNTINITNENRIQSICWQV